MKIKDTWHPDDPGTDEQLPEFVRNVLRGDTSGSVEQAMETAENTAMALGRLLEHLVEHNIISPATAVKLVQPYDRFEFVP